MNYTEPHYEGSRTSSSVLRHTLKILPHPMGRAVAYGLPAGSIRLSQAGLILAATPCTYPLFREAMERAAMKTGCDVLLARHGLHPEVLDPVLWDAVIWSGDQTIMLPDLILYSGNGDHWLVPSRKGAHVRMAADGLHIEAEPDFVTWQERCDGVCRAAKEIIKATRGTEVL